MLAYLLDNFELLPQNIRNLLKDIARYPNKGRRKLLGDRHFESPRSNR